MTFKVKGQAVATALTHIPDLDLTPGKSNVRRSVATACRPRRPTAERSDICTGNSASRSSDTYLLTVSGQRAPALAIDGKRMSAESYNK